MAKQNIILYVNNVPKDAVTSIRRYGKKTGTKYRIGIIYDPNNRPPSPDEGVSDDQLDLVLHCEMNEPLSIARAVLPYQEQFLAITCRGDVNIADFTKVLPHLPYLRASTTQSLLWSIDKVMMRKRFKLYDPTITPKFIVVSDASKETLEKIEERIGFPLIMKPTGLGASLLVNMCYHKEELKKVLEDGFSTIKKIYEQNGRKSEPQILVEQFMEGDMYSIDAYVDSRGKTYFLPPVYVKTGKMIGFDDFFGYLQMTPTNLNATSIKKVEAAAEKSIHALGLRSSTAHIELMRTEEGWKIIELGPRIGGFRHKMYELTLGVDHSLNDVFIHIPKTPVIKHRVKGYAAAMKIFAKQEGKLTKLQGIQNIQKLKSFYEIKVNKKVGDKCTYAKNGGKSVCNIILFNKNRSDLLADIRRIEQTLIIKTE